MKYKSMNAKRWHMQMKVERDALKGERAVSGGRQNERSERQENETAALGQSGQDGGP